MDGALILEVFGDFGLFLASFLDFSRKNFLETPRLLNQNAHPARTSNLSRILETPESQTNSSLDRLHPAASASAAVPGYFCFLKTREAKVGANCC